MEYKMRQNLALLMRQEIDAGISSVINDVSSHLIPEEAILHLQVIWRDVFCFNSAEEMSKK